jgi:hypothetical protein
VDSKRLIEELDINPELPDIQRKKLQDVIVKNQRALVLMIAQGTTIINANYACLSLPPHIHPLHHLASTHILAQQYLGIRAPLPWVYWVNFPETGTTPLQRKD